METNASSHKKWIDVQDNWEIQDKPGPVSNSEQDATFQRPVQDNCVFEGTVGNSTSVVQEVQFSGAVKWAGVIVQEEEHSSCWAHHSLA